MSHVPATPRRRGDRSGRRRALETRLITPWHDAYRAGAGRDAFSPRRGPVSRRWAYDTQRACTAFDTAAGWVASAAMCAWKESQAADCAR